MDKQVIKFKEEMDKNNTNLNVFIKLFNMWTDLTLDERSYIIDKYLIYK